MIGLARKLVEQVVGWRHYQFGPPTEEYVATVMVDTYVQWSQVGLSLRWDPDVDGHHLHLRVGPAGLSALLGRRMTLPDTPDDPGRVCSFPLGNRQMHVYRIRRHVGAVLEWGRVAGRRAIRLDAGPLGVFVEPR